MTDLEYDIQINYRDIAALVQKISMVNAQVNFHYDMFGKKLEELKSLLLKYENDKKVLTNKIHTHIKYEEENNLPTNIVIRKLLSDLESKD